MLATLVLGIQETDRFLRFCQPSLVGKLQAREKELCQQTRKMCGIECRTPAQALIRPHKCAHGMNGQTYKSINRARKARNMLPWLRTNLTT